jgi:hypothetical protein
MKFKKRGKQRGFNMFTAIVAMLLIMVGVVLTGVLVSTEEKNSRRIYSMLNGYQLADVASIARADAMQSFNYNLRERLEMFFTFDEYKLRNEPGFGLFTITKEDTTFDSWEEVVASFEDNILHGGTTGDQLDKVMMYVSEQTINQFQEGTYGKYRVTLSSKEQEAKNALYKVTLDAVAKKPENFLEIVDCTKEGCPVGTFYFNIPLKDIDDKSYESLPRIVVKDTSTQEEIKIPILPKENLRVYVPLRFFKVLHASWITALGVQTSHDDIAKYRLGFCQAGCQPNNTPVGGIGDWKKPCPIAQSDDDKVDLPEKPVGLDKYSAGGTQPGNTALGAYSSQKICARIKATGLFEDDAEEFNNEEYPGFSIFNEKLESSPPIRMEDIAGCKLFSITAGVGGKPSFTVDGTYGTGKMYCGQVTSTTTTIVFKETNPKYIVKGTYEQGTTNLYKIKIQDNSFDVPDGKAEPYGGKCQSATNECKSK